MKKILSYLFAVLTMLCLSIDPAHAVSIDFVGGSGGTVSYAGGATPLVGSGDLISAVFGIPPGIGSAVLVTGGSLDYTTGPFVVGIPTGPGTFIDVFGSGGALAITGGVPAAGIPPGTLLLSGDFSALSTLVCCSASTAAFSGILDVTTVDPTLAAFFGFTPPATGGAVAQTELSLIFSAPPGPGVGFSGTQASVDLDVTPSVPEPASLILLGSGLAGLGLWGRKKLKGVRKC